MSTSVASKLRNRLSFPLEVFPAAIRDSLKAVAEQRSIPVDLVAGAALFAVAALSGNIYIGRVKGGVKPILYIMLVAPSGGGKSPAYNVVCGEIIKPLRKSMNIRHKQAVQEWNCRKTAARLAKQEFMEPPPVKCIRILEDATFEGILKHAESSPAGQGVKYDEGARLFSGITKYTKDASPIDAWNEMWNGETVELVRADSERDRFISDPAISLLIGMQKERLSKYFTEDVLHSGFAYRFLICQGDLSIINEAVDFFDEDRKGMCWEWCELIRGLYHKGAEMTEETPSIEVEFTQDAKIRYNSIMSEIAGARNDQVRAMKKEDENSHLIASGAKLQAYIARLSLVLAIVDNHTGPVISVSNVENAFKLYKFFKRTSESILLGLDSTARTGLTENEMDLWETLPDQQFTTKNAEEICVALNLNTKFFTNSFRRKYSKGWVKSLGKGLYEKI